MEDFKQELATVKKQIAEKFAEIRVFQQHRKTLISANFSAIYFSIPTYSLLKTFNSFL